MDVFPISRARDPDLQSRVILHTVVRHSLTSTYPGTCQISLSWSWRNFVDGPMDGHLRPALLGRLFRVDLKPWTKWYNKINEHIILQVRRHRQCTDNVYDRLPGKTLMEYTIPFQPP